ncbi:hypothetical protein [Demequina iriomotensis]|uniref:hypothetical protein n=1 Tax=Demequina iriomotensis TaxID=1536641 RepID=UPI0007847FD5|nr:hypothetical protein [Demequina iriomotensis]
MSERGRRVTRWVVWALVLAFAFAPVLTVGTCVDAVDPAASYCDSGLASPLMAILETHYPSP